MSLVSPQRFWAYWSTTVVMPINCLSSISIHSSNSSWLDQWNLCHFLISSGWYSFHCGLHSFFSWAALIAILVLVRFSIIDLMLDPFLFVSSNSSCSRDYWLHCGLLEMKIDLFHTLLKLIICMFYALLVSKSRSWLWLCRLHTGCNYSVLSLHCYCSPSQSQ